MADRQLQDYQSNLISSALSIGALKVGGEFVLKSGRVSPYFFYSAALCTGRLIDDLATAYAKFIAASLSASTLPQFDVIFGPAYKGIPLAASVSLLLWRDHGIDVAWAYDRKEAKEHGEGGILVGAPVADKRVLILDDVMTTGTAIRIALRNVNAARGKIVAVVQCLDREEIGNDVENPKLSTVDQVSKDIGGPVLALLGMRDLMAWLQAQGRKEELATMKAYWDKYGIVESPPLPPGDDLGFGKYTEV